MWDGGEDVVRVVFSSIFFISGTITMFFCLGMYRHNQRNKRREYRDRYQSYINTLAVLAASMWIVGVGKLTSILDLLDQGGNHSQYGWWITYGIHSAMLVFAMSAYHRLTMFGIILSAMMSSFAAVSISLLSVATNVQGWALAGTLAGLGILFSHFFVWWKAKRDYTEIRATVLGGRISYRGEDRALIIGSTIISMVILLFLILGSEVTHVVPILATEIIHGILVWLNWGYIVFIVFFWYMDVRVDTKGREKKGKETKEYDWSKDRGGGPTMIHRFFNPFENL
jgi:hypothetical protein